MKTFISGLLPICFAVVVQAQQIKITPGTSIRTSNQLQLVLNNGMHFENNTDLELPDLKILATGSNESRITGTGMFSMGQLQINKTGGSKLVLDKDVNITTEVNFTEGYLELNGHILNLLNNAVLKDENAGSRITGNNGGAVQLTTNLDQPSNENPGNLGLIISSAANPGVTVIRRSHRIFTNGGGSSISRCFEVTPMNNSALNATITLQYFDEELNGLSENMLELYQSPNNGNSWYPRGFTTRDNSGNEISATAIASLNSFTLSTTNNALPVKLSSITLSCNNDQPTLTWKTTNPEDVQIFQIEKSFNSVQWETIRESTAAQSSPLYEYRYADQQLPAKFYRIKSIEHNGEISYSPVLKADCKGRTNSFSLLGNPVKHELQLSIVSVEPKQFAIQVIDPQGRILYSSKLQVNSGQSIQSIPLPAGPNGIMHIRIMEGGTTVWSKAFQKK